MRYDIVISGGGLVGASLAVALAQQGLKTALIDRIHPNTPMPEDGRSSALSLGSRFILQNYGVWKNLEEQAGPIRHIRIVDQEAPGFIHYNHRDVHTEPMGYIVQNRDLHHAACKLLQHAPEITLYAPNEILSAHITPHRAELLLKNNETLHANLLIIAEGRHSHLRDSLGFSLVTRDYHQTAITCNVEHSTKHYEVAHEKFLTPGPFAILPMKDPHHSSIVWTETTEFAPTLMALSEQDFMEQLARRFGNFLGTLSLISPRRSYPLKLLYPKTIVAPRVVLIGDSAHGIHPISGQGFNLGLRDVEILQSKISRQHSLGLDLGSITMLKEYERERFTDVRTMMLVTDGINQLFRSNHPLLTIPRRTGMAIVEHTPALKHFFMRHAMGI